MKRALLILLLMALFISLHGQTMYNNIYIRRQRFLMNYNYSLSVGWERGSIKNIAAVPRVGLVYLTNDFQNKFAGAELGLAVQALPKRFLGIGLDMGLMLLHSIDNTSGYYSGTGFIGPYLTTGKLSRYFELRGFAHMGFVGEHSDFDLETSIGFQLCININHNRIEKRPLWKKGKE